MFVPPRHSAALSAFVQAFLPTLASGIAGIRGLRVSPEDFRHLEALRDHRAILASNHPTGEDPIVILWLSRMLGRPFNYLCAREVLVGPKGWLLNRLGTYSVIRGTADRESIRMTRRLLAEHDRKVVIFPEGEIYQHNDLLLPFQSGVPQLGFWALEDLEKAGKPPALPVLPIAIKYRCCDTARPAIEGSLRGLEQALGLASEPRLTSYDRLVRIGVEMLGAVERDLGIEPGGERSLQERIQEYKRRLMQRVARTLGTEVAWHESPADQLHRLYNDLRSWVGELPEEHSGYDLVLYERRVSAAAPLFNDLLRLQNFIAITGDYVRREPTAERFLEVLGRLEKEVFGTVRSRVPREAVVRVAPPIRLEEHYGEYRKDRRGVVARVTGQMEATIGALLQELAREATPLALEA